MDDDAQMVAIDKDQLARMRGEYGPEKDGCGDLDFDWLDDGWLTLLRRWLNDAQRAGVSEPNAMVLATVADGKPVTRSVLCKILDESGVAFFTSYTSAKGEQLAVTPYASATFPWYQLGRQAHVQAQSARSAPRRYSRIGPCAPGRAAGCVGLAAVAPGRFSRPAR